MKYMILDFFVLFSKPFLILNYRNLLKYFKMIRFRLAIKNYCYLINSVLMHC